MASFDERFGDLDILPVDPNERQSLITGYRNNYTIKPMFERDRANLSLMAAGTSVKVPAAADWSHEPDPEGTPPTKPVEPFKIPGSYYDARDEVGGAHNEVKGKSWDDVLKPEAPAAVPAAVPAAKSSSAWDAVLKPEEEPAPALSKGFFERQLNGFTKYPRDIVDEFMSGLHTTLAAPGQVMGDGTKAPDGIDVPAVTAYVEKQFIEAGASPERAKARAEDVMRSMQRQQGMNNIIMGPIQMVFSPAFAAARSFFSRPLEEAGGPPKETTETFLMVGLAALGLRTQMKRVRVSEDGRMSTETIGDAPQKLDFKNATDMIIDAEYTVVEPTQKLTGPQKLLPAPEGAAPKPEPPAKTEPVAKPDPAVIEENLRRKWEEEGVHPAEVVRDFPNDPFLRDEITTPEPPPTIRGFLDTRGQDAQFTGHPRPVVLDEGFYGSSTSYYGTMHLYTTDAFDVASGYANRRGAREPTIYQVRPPENAKIYDMEAPIAPELLPAIQEMANDPHGYAGELVSQALEENPKNLREFFDAVREVAAGERIPADEVQESVFHPIADLLVEQGYHGMSHRGGLLTKTPEHKVTLYFNPHENVGLEVVDPSLFRPQDPEQVIAKVDAGFGAPPRMPALSPDGLPRTMYPQATAAAQAAGPQGLQAGGGAQPPRVPPTGVGPAQPPPGGGMPPPPPQGPPLQTRPPQPPPFFTYDDRHPLAKAYSNFLKGWQKTFQPELVSDKALQLDPRFAKYKASAQNLKDQIIHNAEDNYQFWRKQSEADRMLYLKTFESGNVPAQWQQRADTHRQMMDMAHKLEVQAGSKADYFENYFPHIFQSPMQARNWVEGQVAQVGPTWFQKQRTFKTIKDALDAGLRLANTNPEYLITHRLISTADMLERMDLLNDMKANGVAITVEQARLDRAQRIQIAQQLGFPIDVTTVGRDLSAEGWKVVNAPDRAQWFIAPDIQPLWENAMGAKGLWGREDLAGNVFRGAMALKNVWVPIKLALSAFHPLHVAHINMTNHITQAVREGARGNWGAALQEYADIVYDPIAAAIPGLPHEGRFARQAWLIPEDQRTPLQKTVVQAMLDGGLVANMSEELKINSKRAFEETVDKHQYLRMMPQLVREAVRHLGAPIFEHWIPNLKVAAYLREYSDFAQQHPQIMADPIQRSVAARTIAKSIENRYGEMFYGSLFWNRTLKDTGIASFLSLGWQTGFIREGVGGVVGPIARGVRSAQRRPTQTEETIYHAQSKIAYVTTYAIGAAVLAGIITYASTGEDPEGMDWYFPRIGTNPDGSPRRVTSMFYSREIPMVEKHIQGTGSVIGGIAETMNSKLVIGPVVDQFRNKDYFGTEIADPSSPLYKQGVQRMAHFFGDSTIPMSITGAQKAMKTGGGWDEAAMAMLGFGPAPSYANKTPIQNEIAGLFHRFVAPEARPHEMGVRGRQRGDIASEILQAQSRGDGDGVRAASQKFLKNGGTPQGLTNILQHIPGDIGQFRALPQEIQERVMSHASPEEKARYAPYLKSDIVARVADLQIEAMQAAGAGDQARATALAGQIQGLIQEGVHTGKIDNYKRFQQSLAKQMQFRLAPQAATQKADQSRQNKIKRFEQLPQPAPP